MHLSRLLWPPGDRNAVAARFAMPEVAFNPNVEFYVHNTLTCA